MLVQYMSDLHLEFGKMEVPDKKGDVLVLAGDINIGTNSMEFLDSCADVFGKVLLVLGNHEFYHNDISTLYEDFKKELVPNVHLLQNNTITLDGITFAGSTLWADMPASAFYQMNDSNYIANGKRQLFSYSDVIEEFNEGLEFLEAVKDDVDVVITHTAPSQTSIDIYRYGKDTIINKAYYTPLLHLFENSRIRTWIHGHTHYCVDYRERDIRVVSNQRGYVNYDEVAFFNPNEVVEI